MPRTTTHTIAVQFGDCDPAGIVFFPNFSRWMDAASLSFFMQCGVPPWRELVKTRGIVGTPLSMPFVVIVLDVGGNPVSGVPVTFAAQGGGHLGGGRTMVTAPTDSDGKAAVTLTLAEQPGISNNIVAAAFENMEGVPVVFKATGVASGPAAQTRVSGVVLDNTDHPVPNATAKIVGTPLQATTNDHGQFSIGSAPARTTRSACPSTCLPSIPLARRLSAATRRSR